MELTIKKGLPIKRYEKKWQFCVGSCHASTLLRADALAILKRVHDELGIKRVRFHGTFNDDMGTLCNFPMVFGMPIGEHIIETNFYKIGVLYDNLLAIGMKPFVEISFMPELLAENPTRSFVYGSIHSLPKDMNKWCEYIKKYLAYLFHRYGEEEVCSWYFEVWNEPDLATTFFKGSKNSYLDFYAATARAIKEFCPKLKVGGPASSASRWIDEFIAFCEENDAPVDFVSTHQYLGEPFLGVSEEEAHKTYEELEAEKEKNKEAEEKRIAFLKQALEKIPEDMSFLEALHTVLGGGDGTEKDYDVNLLPQNAKIVKEQAKGLPVYYTEWNLSASFGARGQDMRKVAAYDMKTSLAIEDIVDGNSIWCYSDIFEELHQFKEPFHGGYGMITYNGIPKPVFYGMRMLAQAEDNRIILDETQFTEVEAAAFEGKKEKQVLLYRQNTRQFDTEPEKVNIRIELENAPVRVYLQRIDENHCNPRKIWEEMGCPNDLTKAETEYIIKASEMLDEELEVQYENGILNVQVNLGINDIYFIRIEKE